MNILSLFDGMSCGQIAINKLGIIDYNYYASEIEKSAIEISKKNYPNTKHIGDVRLIKSENLPKIDLLIGGSPCQGFSFAGKRKGTITKENIEIKTLDQYLEYKNQNFEFQGQSYLFWEYMRTLNEVKPKYFLLENVKMKKEHEETLNKAIGFSPVKINSNLLSAQNRQRLYWVGELQENGEYKKINIEQPQDLYIYIYNILDIKELGQEYYLTEKQKTYLKDFGSKTSFGGKINDINGKADPILRSYGKSSGNGGKIYDKKGIRIFTELEAERLQTVPDGYTEGVNSKKRYEMLGNGWTVDIIAYILKHFIK